MNVATEHRDHDSETSKEEQKLSPRALATLTPKDALSAKNTTASDEAYKKFVSHRTRHLRTDRLQAMSDLDANDSGHFRH